jgi:hypothetical protein
MASSHSSDGKVGAPSVSVGRTGAVELKPAYFPGKCGTDLCTDQQIRETAKAPVDNGMQKLGYEWVVIDDW